MSNARRYTIFAILFAILTVAILGAVTVGNAFSSRVASKPVTPVQRTVAHAPEPIAIAGGSTAVLPIAPRADSGSDDTVKGGLSEVAAAPVQTHSQAPVATRVPTRTTSKAPAQTSASSAPAPALAPAPVVEEPIQIVGGDGEKDAPVVVEEPQIVADPEPACPEGQEYQGEFGCVQPQLPEETIGRDIE